MVELSNMDFSPQIVINSEADANSCKLPSEEDTGSSPLCPKCNSKKVWRDGLRSLSFGKEIQRWLCRDCMLRFSVPNENKNIKKQVETVETIESKLLKSQDDKVINSQICVMETKNLVNPQEIKTCAGEENIDIKGKLVQFAFYCQKEGMSDSTIKTFNQVMTRMAKSG